MAVAADVCGRLGHSAARHRGQMIPCRELPGLVILETARVLGLMSWADPPGRGSPRGGNPGSWWGWGQLAAEVHRKVPGRQGAVLRLMGIFSLHSALYTPGEDKRIIISFP